MHVRSVLSSRSCCKVYPLLGICVFDFHSMHCRICKVVTYCSLFLVFYFVLLLFRLSRFEMSVSEIRFLRVFFSYVSCLITSSVLFSSNLFSFINLSGKFVPLFAFTNFEIQSSSAVFQMSILFRSSLVLARSFLVFRFPSVMFIGILLGCGE